MRRRRRGERGAPSRPACLGMGRIFGHHRDQPVGALYRRPILSPDACLVLTAAARVQVELGLVLLRRLGAESALLLLV